MRRTHFAHAWHRTAPHRTAPHRKYTAQARGVHTPTQRTGTRRMHARTHVVRTCTQCTHTRTHAAHACDSAHACTHTAHPRTRVRSRRTRRTRRMHAAHACGAFTQRKHTTARTWCTLPHAVYAVHACSAYTRRTHANTLHTHATHVQARATVYSNMHTLKHMAWPWFVNAARQCKPRAYSISGCAECKPGYINGGLQARLSFDYWGTKHQKRLLVWISLHGLLWTTAATRGTVNNAEV